MCLLVQQTQPTKFSDEFLMGVYRKNSDGIGVMWAEDSHLHYRKALVGSAKEFVEFIREHAEGRACCWHARMKTHGHIDLTNCHPYPVTGFEGRDDEHPVLLMHNGVLSTGNDKDFSKSDTWHYIQDIIRPMLVKHPELMTNPGFKTLVEKHIGTGNKFAMMDALGNTVILNRQAGVEYNGAWLSNTYAWDYYGLHPDARKRPEYTSPAWSKYDSWYAGKNTSTTVPSKTVKRAPTPVISPSKGTKRTVAKRKPAPWVYEMWLRLSAESPALGAMISRQALGSAAAATSENDVEDMFELLVSGFIDEQKFKDFIQNPNTAPDFRREDGGNLFLEL